MDGRFAFCGFPQTSLGLDGRINFPGANTTVTSSSNSFPAENKSPRSLVNNQSTVNNSNSIHQGNARATVTVPPMPHLQSPAGHAILSAGGLLDNQTNNSSAHQVSSNNTSAAAGYAEALRQLAKHANIEDMDGGAAAAAFRMETDGKKHPAVAAVVPNPRSDTMDTDRSEGQMQAYLSQLAAAHQQASWMQAVSGLSTPQMDPQMALYSSLAGRNPFMNSFYPGGLPYHPTAVSTGYHRDVNSAATAGDSAMMAAAWQQRLLASELAGLQATGWGGGWTPDQLMQHYIAMATSNSEVAHALHQLQQSEIMGGSPQVSTSSISGYPSRSGGQRSINSTTTQSSNQTRVSTLSNQQSTKTKHAFTPLSNSTTAGGLTNPLLQRFEGSELLNTSNNRKESSNIVSDSDRHGTPDSLTRSLSGSGKKFASSKEKIKSAGNHSRSPKENGSPANSDVNSIHAVKAKTNHFDLLAASALQSTRSDPKDGALDLSKSAPSQPPTTAAVSMPTPLVVKVGSAKRKPCKFYRPFDVEEDDDDEDGNDIDSLCRPKHINNMTAIVAPLPVVPKEEDTEQSCRVETQPVPHQNGLVDIPSATPDPSLHLNSDLFKSKIDTVKKHGDPLNTEKKLVGTRNRHRTIPSTRGKRRFLGNVLLEPLGDHKKSTDSSIRSRKKSSSQVSRRLGRYLRRMCRCGLKNTKPPHIRFVPAREKHELESHSNLWRILHQITAIKNDL